MEPDVVVIAIAGPTRSGKSTLATSLAERLGIDPLLDIISADRFFKRQKPYNHELRCIDWEQPEAIDFSRLSSQVETAIRSARNNTVARRPRYLIVEGFLLFAYAPIQRLFNKRIFVNVSQRTCFTRRQASKRVSLDYFNKLLWPSFIKYNQHILQERDVLIVNGEHSPVALVDKALRFIKGEPVSSEVELLQQSLAQREMLTDADLMRARAAGGDSSQGYREGQERRNALSALKRRAESPERKQRAPSPELRRKEPSRNDNTERPLKVSRPAPAAAVVQPIVLPVEPNVAQAIRKRIDEYLRHVPLVVLISTGSFAPIHSMHIQMMEVARKFVERTLNRKVVAGILSPSSDSYVNSKLKKRGEPLLEQRKLTLENRVLLVEDAIRLQNWLFVSDWEATQSSDIPFTAVVKHFESEFTRDRPNLKVIYVCGVDHLLKGVSLWQLRDSGVIAVARPGYDTAEAQQLLERKYGQQRFVHIVKDDSIAEVSSTAIRKKLDSCSSLKDLVPEAVERRLQALHPPKSVNIIFTHAGQSYSEPLPISDSVTYRSLSTFREKANAPCGALEITLLGGSILRLAHQSDRIEHANGSFTAVQHSLGNGPLLVPQRIELSSLSDLKLILK